MSENQQDRHDPLEEAIRAFRAMPVCDRPPDAVVVARLGMGKGNACLGASLPGPAKTSGLPRIVTLFTAAAVLMFVVLAYFWWNSSPPQPVNVPAPVTPAKGGAVAVEPVPGKRDVQRASVGSLAERVAEAQVIVVATGLDSTPAPPEVPGDSPEVSIRWQVKRVLKGNLIATEFTTRTSTAAAEFVDKEWIVFLTPAYMAGQHQLAACLHVDFESTIVQLLGG